MGAWPVASLRCREGFVSVEEERRLLATLGEMAFGAVTMRGQTARRTVRHFGLDYAYETGELVPTDPLPDAMLWLRDRCAALMQREPADLVQILVSRYPPGAGIGWHRDAPMFGSKIAGVSLGVPCRMRFQRTVRGERSVAALELAPRSAYLLGGKARAGRGSTRSRRRRSCATRSPSARCGARSPLGRWRWPPCCGRSCGRTACRRVHQGRYDRVRR